MYGDEERKHPSLKWIIIAIVLVISIIVILLFSGINVKKDNDKSLLSFSQKEYSCNAGETLDIKVNIPEDNKELMVKSMNSSDEDIATISSSSNGSECENCQELHVFCKREGNVTLNIEDNKGKKNTVNLIVKNKMDIRFEKNSYTCDAGDIFETQIIVSDKYSLDSIESYSASDESIAIIDDLSNTSVNCIDCKVVRVVCLKDGTTKLNATLTNGEKTSVDLVVNVGDNPTPVSSLSPSQESIEFEKSSYNCIVGDSFETTINITNGSSSSSINSYNSSDTSIATIDDNTSTNNSSKISKKVQVNCLKKGTASIVATSSSGAIANATVNVISTSKTPTPSNTPITRETVSFTRSSFNCKEGEVFETMITVTSSNAASTISSFTSSNSSIATIELTKYQPNTLSQRMVKVSCLSKGRVTLTAKSSNGVSGVASLVVSSAPVTSTPYVKESILFTRSNFTCHAGEVFETLVSITGGNSNSAIASFTSSDSTIATVDDKATYQPNTLNSRMLRVSCLKTGSVKLTVKSNLGTNGLATVTVK